MNKAILKAVLVKTLSFLLTAGYAFTAQADYLPARMQALLNTRITHSGPNCWNSALVASGVLSHFRFVSPLEFHFWAESEACEKIPVGQQHPGDVQIYRRTMPGLDDESREVHANIWLRKDSTFNKMTDYPTAAYELTSNDAVNANYGKTPEIINFNPPGVKGPIHCTGSECDNFIEYRRCDSRKASQLRKADLYYSEKIEKLIHALEISIQRQVQSDYLPTAEWKTQSLAVLASVEQELALLGCTSQSFYCKATAEAVGSLRWQIERTHPNWLKPHE